MYNLGFTAAGSGALAVVGTVVVWATEKKQNDLSYKIPLAVQVVCKHHSYYPIMPLTQGSLQAFPAVLAILSLFLTESPFWLLSKSKGDLARKNLSLLRGGNSELASAELKVQELALAASAEEAKKQGKWTEMFNKKNIERTFTASSFISIAQVCGQALAGSLSVIDCVKQR